jgi:hypothetical protein
MVDIRLSRDGNIFPRTQRLAGGEGGEAVSSMYELIADMHTHVDFNIRPQFEYPSLTQSVKKRNTPLDQRNAFSCLLSQKQNSSFFSLSQNLQNLFSLSAPESFIIKAL